MLKKCFKFHSIPSSITEADDLELGEKILNYEINNQRQFYNYCFPEDLWRNIINYLSFLQLANLAEINEFFYSICAPRLETFKAKGTPILIKIDKENLKINTFVISIKGLKLDEVEKIIKEKLCEDDLLPTAELALEQDPVFFSSKWITFWSNILRYISPTRPYLTKLSLKNLHLSKDDFLQFLRFSKSLNYITFKNVIFNQKINIGTELYEENHSLKTIEIFMSPSLVCDWAARKFALLYHPGKQVFEYCRENFEYRQQSMPCPSYQQHLLPYKNFTFDMFWVINTIPLFFVIINYILLYTVYMTSYNCFNNFN
uniref:F-box domain-containing protein n=1 Tax=Panagrolaimus sp. PS1159 TaxID=55785 RepID=A0AC35G1C7_9BILA